MRRFIESWDKLAREDPFWAVLTADDKRGQRWDPEAFFATGVADVARVMSRLESMGVQPRGGRALDFGCGLGRLTRALAARFQHADGVDVSSEMVQRAASLAREPNVRFLHNPRADLSQLESGAYRFVLSLISLQHMPQPLALGYVDELCRVLEAGGVAYVQLSTFLDPRNGEALAKLARDESRLNRAYRAMCNLFRRHHRMDTYYCRLSEVLAILEKRRMRILSVLPDDSLPAPFISHVVIFARPADG